MTLDIKATVPKEKMGLKERFSNTWAKFMKLDENGLLTLRNSIFFILVGDLLGIYYFLGLKTLGIGILIVSMAALALILWRLRDFPQETEKKDEKWFKPKDKPEEKPEPEKSFIEFDAGLGTSEDYNKRLEKAIGNPL